MKHIITSFYALYGRYITRYRSIPFFIDGLKLVERRLLLGLHETAKNKFVKSAKVIGHTLAEYHPHGDLSLGKSLQQLVQRGFAEGEGNWGSKGLVDGPAAASRYTEVKAASWLEELAFKYINFVPWEDIEYNKEPIYLPSPIPIGLIGKGITSGITFHRTLIPRYELKDLAKRLKCLIENNFNLTLENPGDIIIPSIDGCLCKEVNEGEFLKILLHGEGIIKTIPYGEIKNGKIFINGRSPNSNFSRLIENCEDVISGKTKEKKKKSNSNIQKMNIKLIDCSKSSINVMIETNARQNLTTLMQDIWNSYLISNFNISCIICNDKNKAETVGIDKILYNSYVYWRQAVLNKCINDLNLKNKELFHINVINIIKDIIQKFQITNVNDIVNIFKTQYKSAIPIKVTTYENNNWVDTQLVMVEDDIKNTCSSKSIKQLVENKKNETDILTDISQCYLNITNLDSQCYSMVCSLLN